MERLQAALERAREKRASGREAPESGRAEPAVPDRSARGTTGQSRRDAATDAASAEAAFDAIERIEIPQRRLARNRIVAFDSGPISSEYDVLRTKVRQMMAEQNWTRVAITSPDANCGKSLTALNLAASYSRLSGARVILMEMDMRRPSLAREVGYRGNDSVENVLTGDISFGDQARRIAARVAVAMNARTARDPSEILSRDSTAGVLDEIQATYAPTVMIFDMPPALLNDDTRAFLSLCDAAVIVARAEATTVSRLDVCEQEVGERTNVLGTVLNGCRFRDGVYSYSAAY